MKAVMIIFNQSLTERVEFIFDTLNMRGYTWWSDVQGRGSKTGDPRHGTHTWPEMNSAALVIIPSEKTDSLLEAVKKLDEVNTEVGIRAFVMPVEKMY